MEKGREGKECEVCFPQNLHLAFQQCISRTYLFSSVTSNTKHIPNHFTLPLLSCCYMTMVQDRGESKPWAEA